MGFEVLKEACGVNYNTVINWVKQAANNLQNAPDGEEIPEIAQFEE